MAKMTADHWEIILETVEQEGLSVYRAAAVAVWSKDLKRRPGGYTKAEVDAHLEAVPTARDELEIAMACNLADVESRIVRKAKKGDIKDAGKLLEKLVDARMPEYNKANTASTGLSMDILSELERSAETLSRKIEEKVQRYQLSLEIEVESIAV